MYEYFGMYYPSDPPRAIPPERMWELHTMDGVRFTLLYRVSSGLSMQRQECEGLGPVMVTVARLGAHVPHVKRVAIRLRDFRQTVDMISQWIPMELAFLVGHYWGIQPIEETTTHRIHTGRYGN